MNVNTDDNEDLKRIFTQKDFESSIDSEELQKIEDRLWIKISAKIEESKKLAQSARRVSLKKYVKIALSILFLLGLVVLYLFYGRPALD